ncbi:hypothetical protein DL96DRAFT_115131 [Flagelloscypha sp. PMI_526]|nr:hypothetical protein DL96DRAFT_115131 [Flagelloscypha sp. PMI_526]
MIGPVLLAIIMENNLHPRRKSKAVISRMAHGLVACAECKRMKLKCDKKVPCSTCVRRECSSICPTGILISRRASRTILPKGSSARRTQDDITQLRERNLKLEESLHPHDDHKTMLRLTKSRTC